MQIVKEVLEEKRKDIVKNFKIKKDQCIIISNETWHLSNIEKRKEILEMNVLTTVVMDNCLCIVVE